VFFLKAYFQQALRGGSNSADLFASAVEKLRSAIDIDSLSGEFQQALATVLLDFSKALVQRCLSADGHGSKTSLRQALDKIREALKLAPVLAARSILETARGLAGNRTDLSYEAAFQLLDLLRKSNADASALADALLLEWTSSLMRAIQFCNAREVRRAWFAFLLPFSFAHCWFFA
jgi:hypothetical protein